MANHASVLIIAQAGRIRDGLEVLLRACKGIELIGLVGDGASGLEQIATGPPALVLLDTELPFDEAWHVLQQIRHKWPQVRSLVVAHTSSQQRQAERAGAAAVLRAGFSAESFFDAVQDLINEYVPASGQAVHRDTPSTTPTTS